MKNVLPILLFFSALLCFSQETTNDIDVLASKYGDYFELPRETFYTHLNKTSFVQGENIWFKTYAHDRHLDQMSQKTTNVHVGIYDSQGMLLSKDVWFAENGSTQGNIFIDSTFAPGDYYIKASSNWMRNFKENDAFVQKIRILGNEPISSAKALTANTYDIQFLPEGGYLVEDVYNVLGYKILDNNGKSVETKGTLYDDKNRVISEIHTNAMGMGKILFKPKSGRTYLAKIDLNQGSEVTKAIPEAKARGIALQANILDSTHLTLKLSTNLKTLKRLKGKDYAIVIHKNGEFKSIPFSFEEETTKSLTVPKTDLFPDVNTITVFDEKGQPIIERLVFNHNFKASSVKYAISHREKKNDSLVYALQAINQNTSESVAGLSNLSISVLPSTTKAYNPNHNMLSANYLKPYVNGHIDSPVYYFNDITKKKRYDLDLLLLTQGWSRYDWDRIFLHTPEPIHRFENGMTLQGRLVKPEQTKTLKLQEFGLIGNQWKDVAIGQDNIFKVENLYPLKGETIRVAYLDGDRKYRKPSLTLNITSNDYQDRIASYDLWQEKKAFFEEALPEYIYEKGFAYREAELLQEVLLEARQKELDARRPENTVRFPSVGFDGRYTEITESTTQKYLFLTDFLRAEGYMVGSERADVGGPFSLRGPRGGNPLVFLDGVRMFSNEPLRALNMRNIEGVYIDRAGFALGFGDSGGVIRIFTRITPLVGPKASKDYAYTITTDTGFAKAKEFYNPAYKDYTTDFFKSYGTISWLPNVQVVDNTSSLFKVADTESDVTNFYIEGYDAQGNLVSQVVTLSN